MMLRRVEEMELLELADEPEHGSRQVQSSEHYRLRLSLCQVSRRSESPFRNIPATRYPIAAQPTANLSRG